jgi:hypothetical protein
MSGKKDVARAARMACVLAAIIILSSLTVHLQPILNSDQASNKVSFSAPSNFVQITFTPSRPTSLDCFKQKRNSPFATQSHENTHQMGQSGTHAAIRGLSTPNILCRANLQEIFLLLDLPPPSISALF